MAAATSTGGISWKRPGRVGDSPLPGAGTWADAGVGAASATGHGESIIRALMTRVAIDRLRAGATPDAGGARGGRRARARRRRRRRHPRRRDGRAIWAAHVDGAHAVGGDRRRRALERRASRADGRSRRQLRTPARLDELLVAGDGGGVAGQLLVRYEITVDAAGAAARRGDRPRRAGARRRRRRQRARLRLVSATAGTLGVGGYLRLIALAPGQRRAGAGGALLDEVEADVATRARHLFLLVSHWNEGARRFYAARGYAEVGRLPAFVRADTDEIICWKRLP